MTWLLALPGHQLWYCLFKPGRSLYYMKKNFNSSFMSVWGIECKYMLMFLLRNLARKELMHRPYNYVKEMIAGSGTATLHLSGAQVCYKSQVTHCGLVSPYGDIDLNQCWLILSNDIHLRAISQDTNQQNKIQNYLSKIPFQSPKGQRVNSLPPGKYGFIFECAISKQSLVMHLKHLLWNFPEFNTTGLHCWKLSQHWVRLWLGTVRHQVIA